MFFGTNKTEGSLLVDESIMTAAVTLVLASGIASLEAVLIDDAAAVSIVMVDDEAGAEIGVIIPTDVVDKTQLPTMTYMWNVYGTKTKMSVFDGTFIANN